MRETLQRIESFYRLQEVVGRGAFGEVVRAVDLRNGATVAIKRLVGARNDTSKFERFEREASLLAQVRSPHVVRYIEHGIDEQDTPLLVLEWLDGQDLSARQQSNPLTTTSVLRFATQALLGLSALHQLNIVHRDVKPANFYLVGDRAAPVVKLIDLGIARAVTGLSLTSNGLRVGTPAYMSPEQARGDELIGPRSDLFSLGVVLYELLAGSKPFRASDPHALLAKIVLQQAPDLRSVVGVSVPSSLAQLVARLLEKYPENRFATAQDVLAAMPDEWSVSHNSVPPVQLHTDDVATAELSSAGLSVLAEKRVISALFANYANEARDSDRHSFERAVLAQDGVVHRLIGGRSVGLFGLSRSTGTEVHRAAQAALVAVRTSQQMQLALVIGRVTTDRSEVLSSDAIERGMSALSRPSVGKLAPQITVDAASARLLTAQYVLEYNADGTAILQTERRSDEAVPQFGTNAKLTVGRDREISSLCALARESVADSVARVALVTGASGVGTTRVRRESVAQIVRHSPDTLVVTGYCDSINAGTPYAVIGNALLHASAAIKAQDAVAKATAILQLVSASVADRAKSSIIAGFFLSICNIHLTDEQLASLFEGDFVTQWRVACADPVVLGDGIRSAWLDWVAAATTSRSLLVVLENLQWTDRSSIQLIDAMLRTFYNRPVCVLAFGRSQVYEQYESLWAERSVLEVRLAPLSRRASQSLLRQLVGDGFAHESLVLDRADGNPFFIAELVRSLMADSSVDALPDSIAGMVQVQLDALESHERRLLRLCSVMGQSFWRGSAVALLTAGPQDWTISGPLRGWLRELEHRGLIDRKAQSTIADDEEFAFRHSVVRDVAYEMLTDDDRVSAHRRAALWLEQVSFGSALVLAEQFEKGSLAAHAARYYARAAESAMAGDDLPAALQYARRAQEQAARAMHAQTDTTADDRLTDARVDAHFVEAEVHRWQGRLTHCVTAVSEAMRLAPRASARWFRAVGEKAIALARTSQYDQLTDIAAQWMDAQPAIDSVGACVQAGGRLAAQLVALGQLELGKTVLARLTRLELKHAPLDTIATARLAQARAQLALHEGDRSSYLRWITTTMNSFAMGGDRRNHCVQGANLGNALMHLGAYADARTVLLPLLDQCERLGLPTGLAFAQSILGLVSLRLGDAASALSLQTRAVEYFLEHGDLRMLAFGYAYLAEAHLALNQLTDAERTAQLALNNYVAMPATRAYVMTVLSKIRLAQRDFCEALVLSTEAVEILAGATDAIEEGEISLLLTHANALVANEQKAQACVVIQRAEQLVMQRALLIDDPRLRALFLAIDENNHVLRWQQESASPASV